MSVELFRSRACESFGLDPDNFESSLLKLIESEPLKLAQVESLARECGIFDRESLINPVARAQLAELWQYDSQIPDASIDLLSLEGVLDPVRLGFELLRSTKQLTDQTLTEIATTSIHELSTTQKQKAAWVSISTSLGREASVPILINFLRNELPDLTIQKYTTENKSAVLTKIDWLLSLSHSMEAQHKFSPVHVASRVLAAKIRRFLKDSEGDTAKTLAVSACHTVSSGFVGWSVYVLEQGGSDAKALDTLAQG